MSNFTNDAFIKRDAECECKNLASMDRMISLKDKDLLLPLDGLELLEEEMIYVEEVVFLVQVAVVVVLLVPVVAVIAN